MLTQLLQYLRAAASRGCTTSHVGPFLVTIDEDTDHPYLNYASFAVEDRLQAMTATRAVTVAPPDGYALVVPESDADLTAMLGVQNVAYDGVCPAQLRASRLSQAAGGIVVAVRREQDGRIVGGGVAAPPAGSAFTEVAGIAIDAGHRRRGLATALASELTRRALAAGVRTAFLTPRDDEVARLYSRAGYTRTAQMLHVRRG